MYYKVKYNWTRLEKPIILIKRQLRSFKLYECTVSIFFLNYRCFNTLTLRRTRIVHTWHFVIYHEFLCEIIRNEKLDSSIFQHWS